MRIICKSGLNRFRWPSTLPTTASLNFCRILGTTRLKPSLSNRPRYVYPSWLAYASDQKSQCRSFELNAIPAS